MAAVRRTTLVIRDTRGQERIEAGVAAPYSRAGTGGLSQLWLSRKEAKVVTPYSRSRRRTAESTQAGRHNVDCRARERRSQRSHRCSR
eukprot:3875219-Pleurochrysis_carterae.AAC.2